MLQLRDAVGIEQAQDAQTFYSLFGPNPLSLVNACFVLVTLGQISLNFLLGTLLFSGRVRKRNVTLVNLLLVTLASTAPPELLYCSGYTFDPQPPFALCMTQTILKYGTDPMFIVASLALILEVLYDTLLLPPVFRSRQARTWFLVALPYLIFLIFAVWAAALGATHKNVVQHEPNTLYCSITFTSFNRGTEIFSAMVAVFTLSLEVYAFVVSHMQWRHIAKLPTFGRAFIIRILAFSSLQVFYFVLLGLDFFVDSVVMHVIPIVYEALMPLATFFIFASTEDCIAVWKSWFTGTWRPPPEMEEMKGSRWRGSQSSLMSSRASASSVIGAAPLSYTYLNKGPYTEAAARIVSN